MPAKAGTLGRTSTAYAGFDPRFRGGDGKRGMGAICLVHTTSDTLQIRALHTGGNRGAILTLPSWAGLIVGFAPFPVEMITR